MHLLLHEADRLAAPEAPLRVVAGRRRNRAGAHERQCLDQRVGVLLDVAVRAQRDGRRQAGLLAGGGRDEHLLLRQLARRARRP